jgi:long-chain fatty acid transport protein
MSRRRLAYSFLTVVFVLFLSTPVFGAGFALYEGSARGNVLGAGLTASADDPSAVFYNPAGITQLKGTQVQLGFTAISPIISVETTVPAGRPYQAAGSYKTDFDGNWFFPPHAYLTYQINDKWWFGLGEFSRYGLGTEFKAPINPGWPGRYNSYRATIQEFEINPNIAYKVNEKFSVAAGLVGSYFNLNLSRVLATQLLPGQPADTDFKLSGDSWGWGWDLALQYKPFDWMQFGITYRSKIEQNVKGNVEVNRTITAFGSNIANMSAGGDLTLPDTIYTGLNFNVTKTWSVGGGVYWTGWQYYDKLQVNFSAPFGTPPPSTTSVSPKNWANVARYMIGTEWKATENWDLRLGYAYDVCPIPDNTLDYILPDNDRHMFSIGAGYHQAAWSVDLSYTYMAIIDRSYSATNTLTSPSNTYAGRLTNGSAHLIGLTLGYKF